MNYHRYWHNEAGMIISKVVNTNCQIAHLPKVIAAHVEDHVLGRVTGQIEQRGEYETLEERRRILKEDMQSERVRTIVATLTALVTTSISIVSMHVDQDRQQRKNRGEAL